MEAPKQLRGQGPYEPGAFLKCKCWCCGLCYNHQNYKEHGRVEEPMAIPTTSRLNQRWPEAEMSYDPLAE